MQKLPDGTDWLRGAPPQNETRAFRCFENGKINHIKPFYLKRVIAVLKEKWIIEIDFKNARELSSSVTLPEYRYFLVRSVKLDGKYSKIRQKETILWMEAESFGSGDTEKYPLIICTKWWVTDLYVSAKHQPFFCGTHLLSRKAP